MHKNESSDEEEEAERKSINFRSQATHKSVRLSKQDMSILALSENKDDTNDKFSGKVAEIKEMVLGITENMTENFNGIKAMVEEQDKEILANHKMLLRIDNQIKSVCNELAHYNMTKEEHELLINELVKESNCYWLIQNSSGESQSFVGHERSAKLIKSSTN